MKTIAAQHLRTLLSVAWLLGPVTLPSVAWGQDAAPAKSDSQPTPPTTPAPMVPASTASPVLSQPADDPNAAKNAGKQLPPTPDVTPQVLQRLTADALIRLALFNIRSVPVPSADDYAAGAAIFGIAQSLAPDDEEVLKRRTEAAWGAGDQELLMKLTEQLVRVDPRNTVAQLRLISGRLASFQTIEERLSRLEQLIGPRGASLDPSIRSRLALDAALLYRERGDDSNFIERLKLATQLDSTNKDAALMALNVFTSRVDDEFGRLEMLANLLYSDPLDPNIHMMLAQDLASQGAFNQSRRFHRISQKIFSTAGTAINLQRTLEAIALDWRCDGAKAAHDYIVEQLTKERNVAAREAREMRKQEGQPIAVDIPKPEEVRLDLQFEQIRMATSLVLDNRSTLAEAIKDFAATIDNRILVLSTPAARDPGVTQESADADILSSRQELNLWRFMINLEVDKANETLAACIDNVAEDDPRRVSLEIWQAIRSGDNAKATQLANKATTDDADGHLVLARAAAFEATGNKALAIDTLRELNTQAPLTILGTLAYERMNSIAGIKTALGDEDTPRARAASTYAQGVPMWIDKMIEQPTYFQTLRVEGPGARIQPLDRVTYTLSIRNISPIPLAFGSDKPINTRFLFSPLLEIGSSPRDNVGEPEVYEFDRRFRLMPNEELKVELWPEAGVIGYLAQNGTAGPTRLRWRVMQGFEVRNGAKDRGPGCLEITTSTTAREAMLESRLPAEQLEPRITAATDANIVQVLVAVRALLIGPSVEKAAPDVLATLIQSLATAYPTWTPTSRLFAASMLPPVSQVPELQPVEDAIRADTDKQVQLVTLLSRVSAADDPMLETAKQSGDATLVRAAELQIKRINATEPTYAKVGSRNMITRGER